MADNRHINENYATIAAELIDTEDVLLDIKNSHATIVYLSSDHDKKEKDRLILGQCERVADKYKWGIPADFTITLFDPNLQGKSDEAIRRVILHELLHVGIEFKKDGTEGYSIKPHDIEDFKYLIDKYGTDWSEV